MHTLRKARLTFGIVVIETNVHTAVADSDSEVSLARMHDKCKTRLGKPYYCPTCKEAVEADHQLVAYPLTKSELIELDKDDLASTVPEHNSTIELTKFINSVELNPMLKTKPYWLSPSGGLEGDRGYALLWNAMVEGGDVALGISTLWGKEHPVSIEADERGLVMWMLAQQNDIVIPDFVIPSLTDCEQRIASRKGELITEKEAVKRASQNLETTEMLLTKLQGQIQPEDFYRPLRERLRLMIENKMAGVKSVPVEQTTPDTSPDLMEAIRQSIKNAPKKQARRVRVSA